VRIHDLAAVLGRWLKPAEPGTATEIRSGTSRTARPAVKTPTERHRATQSVTAPPRPEADADGLDQERIGEILADGGVAFLASLLETYRDDSQRLLTVIERALAEEQSVVAAQATHELKGASSGLGLLAVVHACLALEHALTTGMADTSRWYGELKHAHALVMPALERLAGGPST